MSYAKKTTVSVEKTKAEIESLIAKYKADSFISGWQGDKATVMFRCRDLMIRFVLTMPNIAKFSHGGRYGRQRRSPSAQEAEHNQACRSIWRSLLLCIKAKLESVESGIETFEEAFLAHVVLPNNETVGTWAKEAIPQAYASGQMPQLALPAAKP